MDVPAELKELSATLASIEAVVDLPTLRAELASLEKDASAPDLWDDTDNAQKVTSRLSYVQGEIRRVEELRSRLDDAQVLWDRMMSVSPWHGVTTVVMGNCGFGVAPTRPAHRDLIVRTLEKVEGMSAAALRAGLGDVETPHRLVTGFGEPDQVIRRQIPPRLATDPLGHMHELGVQLDEFRLVDENELALAISLLPTAAQPIVLRQQRPVARRNRPGDGTEVRRQACFPRPHRLARGGSGPVESDQMKA